MASRDVYATEPGTIVQMDIVWRTLCVSFRRRRNVCQTETRDTYDSNRDVSLPLNGMSCIALRDMRAVRDCKVMDRLLIKQFNGVEIPYYHTKAISNRKSIFMSGEIGLRTADPLSMDMKEM